MGQFYSNNNKELLSKIHKLNCCLGSLEDFTDNDVMMEYVIEKQQRNDFHSGLGFVNESCSTLICRICSTNELIVGQAAFFTAVRCKNCDYEVAVHEG